MTMRRERRLPLARLGRAAFLLPSPWKGRGGAGFLLLQVKSFACGLGPEEPRSPPAPRMPWGSTPFVDSSGPISSPRVCAQITVATRSLNRPIGAPLPELGEGLGARVIEWPRDRTDGCLTAGGLSFVRMTERRNVAFGKVPPPHSSPVQEEGDAAARPRAWRRETAFILRSIRQVDAKFDQWR